MPMYVYYCPVCGGINRKDKSTYTCKDCQSTVPDAKSEYQIDYYEQKSVTLYDTSKFWDYLLLEEEIKKNPLYDESKVTKIALLKLNGQRKEIQQIIEFQNNRQNNMGYSYYTPQDIPACPACHSNNVKKIFDVNRINPIASAAAMGSALPMFDKQYECGDCGTIF